MGYLRAVDAMAVQHGLAPVDEKLMLGKDPALQLVRRSLIQVDQSATIHTLQVEMSIALLPVHQLINKLAGMIPSKPTNQALLHQDVHQPVQGAFSWSQGRIHGNGNFLNGKLPAAVGPQEGKQIGFLCCPITFFQLPPCAL